MLSAFLTDVEINNFISLTESEWGPEKKEKSSECYATYGNSVSGCVNVVQSFASTFSVNFINKGSLAVRKVQFLAPL